MSEDRRSQWAVLQRHIAGCSRAFRAASVWTGRAGQLVAGPIPSLSVSWVDYFTAAGGSSAVLATAGGALASVRYGRKATVQIEATAHVAASGVILAVRPSVRALGVFSLRLKEDDGSTATVTEVWAAPDGLTDGRTWQSPIFFGANTVGAGETIWTTALFDVGPPLPGLIGWRALGTIRAARFFRSKEWVWDDRVFVPRPGDS